MSLARLLAVSIGDWRERLRHVTTAPADTGDDNAWWRTLDASLIGRSASAVTAAFRRAYPESKVAQVLGPAATQSPITRVRFVGEMTIVAALVHIVLMWPSRQVGFWWLIVPSVALAFGFLATSVAMRAGRR